jgi:hypothetical protein
MSKKIKKTKKVKALKVSESNNYPCTAAGMDKNLKMEAFAKEFLKQNKKLPKEVLAQRLTLVAVECIELVELFEKSEAKILELEEESLKLKTALELTNKDANGWHESSLMWMRKYYQEKRTFWEKTKDACKRAWRPA